LRRLRIARVVVQIEQARARWNSHAFKEFLLQASQEFRIFWYHKDKSHHSNNNMDHAYAVDVSRTGQRGVNSTGDTVTRTITSASDSAA
jgi:hypothetical protein